MLGERGGDQNECINHQVHTCDSTKQGSAIQRTGWHSDFTPRQGTTKDALVTAWAMEVQRNRLPTSVAVTTFAKPWFPRKHQSSRQRRDQEAIATKSKIMSLQWTRAHVQGFPAASSTHDLLEGGVSATHAGWIARRRSTR
jgi:hypothetical protein